MQNARLPGRRQYKNAICNTLGEPFQPHASEEFPGWRPGRHAQTGILAGMQRLVDSWYPRVKTRPVDITVNDVMTKNPQYVAKRELLDILAVPSRTKPSRLPKPDAQLLRGEKVVDLWRVDRLLTYVTKRQPILM